MGLSYAQDYTYSQHFQSRALERFNVPKEKLQKWINQNVNTFVPYDNGVEQTKNRQLYVSEKGIVFVCDEIERNFITCFEANDLLKEGKQITIHDNNVEMYRDELLNLQKKYELKDAKELLEAISETIDDFYHHSQQLSSRRLTLSKYQLLEKIISEFHVIKSVFRTIEGKSKDFK